MNINLHITKQRTNPVLWDCGSSYLNEYGTSSSFLATFKLSIMKAINIML